MDLSYQAICKAVGKNRAKLIADYEDEGNAISFMLAKPYIKQNTGHVTYVKEFDEYTTKKEITQHLKGFLDSCVLDPDDKIYKSHNGEDAVRDYSWLNKRG